MTEASARTRARWLVLAMIAGGCDDEAEPTYEPMEETPAENDDGAVPASGDGGGDDGADGDGGAANPDDPTPTFAADVLPILNASCSCHGAGAEAGVDLSEDAAFDTLLFGEASIGVPFVEPEDPDASYLVLKLRGEQASVGGGGSRMPLGSPLGEDAIIVIERWIAGGAPE